MIDWSDVMVYPTISVWSTVESDITARPSTMCFLTVCHFQHWFCHNFTKIVEDVNCRSSEKLPLNKALKFNFKKSVWSLLKTIKEKWLLWACVSVYKHKICVNRAQLNTSTWNQPNCLTVHKRWKNIICTFKFNLCPSCLKNAFLIS